MKNTRLGLTERLLGITLSAASAYAAAPITQPVYRTENITGTKIERVSNANFPYSTEKVRFYGEIYTIQSNPLQEKNELGFILRKEEDTNLRIDLNTNNVKEISDYFFVPTRVEVNGKPANRLSLTTEGPGAIKAKSHYPTTQKADAEVITLDQNNLEFYIGTTSVNGNQFFFPRVEKTSSDVLPLYLIPTSTSTFRIKRATGEVTILNYPDGIYQPQRISEKDYATRVVKRAEVEAQKKAELEAKKATEELKAKQAAEEKLRNEPGKAGKIE
ncbi:MAG: cell envelope integrity protein TolA [Nanoarchaeota archaeon]|nr:cell envelope integrity protein TolA [Nanoarchaeota archaeon]